VGARAGVSCDEERTELAKLESKNRCRLRPVRERQDRVESLAGTLHAVRDYAVDIPANNQANSTARTWNDANGNYVPDCDLRNPAANGECGGWSDLSFGQIRAGSTHRAADALGGYNLQDFNWQAAVQVQHELRRNVALNAGYFRTWYGNFLVTDNQATTPADYDPFCITVPSDQRLPGGGGNQICGLYDIKPTASAG
jgi:hypothetical protein